MSSARAKLLGLFLLAVTARAILIASFLSRFPDLHQWGNNEQGVIGRSLLLAHSFSSPYHDASGPTAWIAPIYPIITGAIFAVFGIQSSTSAIVAIALNALCSSLVSIVLYKIGSEFLSERAGLIAGLLWAVSPAVALVTLLVWDTCLTTLLATWACLLTLRLAAGNSRSYAMAGALWALAGLSSPSILAPLPFLAFWLWAKTRQLKPAVILSAGAALILLPWTLRNYLVFHKLVPVRDNFWAEVFFGNIGFQAHPLKTSMEYQNLGELQFIEMTKQHVLVYIHGHFAEFVRQTLHRIGQFWIQPEGMWKFSFFLSIATLVGVCLMAKRRLPAAMPFLIILATYPLTYYVSYTFSRYRHPIEPIMYSSAGFLLVETGKRLRGKKPPVETKP